MVGSPYDNAALQPVPVPAVADRAANLRRHRLALAEWVGLSWSERDRPWSDQEIRENRRRGALTYVHDYGRATAKGRSALGRLLGGRNQQPAGSHRADHLLDVYPAPR